MSNLAPRPQSRSLLTESIRTRLNAIAGDDLRFDVPLSSRTTLRIGGPADALYTPSSIEQLGSLISACAAQTIPLWALGSGSNLLVRDGGVRGVAICTRSLRRIEREDREIIVQSGVSTGKLLSLATMWELGGVEFLGGVPGSIGGGVIMNAGTYLGEFVDVVTRVDSISMQSGEVVRRSAAECGFVYRGSSIPKTEIVTEVCLKLTPRPRAEIAQEVRALRKRRKQREPHKVSNSGSTFKNPPGDFAGRLIESAGLKGTRIGGALCSPDHANWLVNAGRASAKEMSELIELVRARVEEVHGITLELEVKVIGEP